MLPKYGFPVDSVELRTNFGYGKDAGAKLDLTRDLSQAIYEYAPDATLVAGGQLWTSRGIYRLPGRDLVEYEYHVCKRCGGFRHGVGDVDAACQHCGEVAPSAPRKLTIPEFGFVAGREPEKPGPRPPQRSWSGAVHVLAPPPEAHLARQTLPGGKLELSTSAPAVGSSRSPTARQAMGFWVCDWCGHGAARIAPRSQAAQAQPPAQEPALCNGPQRLVDLGAPVRDRPADPEAAPARRSRGPRQRGSPSCTPLVEAVVRGAGDRPRRHGGVARRRSVPTTGRSASSTPSPAAPAT